MVHGKVRTPECRAEGCQEEEREKKFKVQKTAGAAAWSCSRISYDPRSRTFLTFRVLMRTCTQ